MSRKISKRSTRKHTALRVQNSELDIIKKAAKHERMSLNSFIAKAALRAAEKSLQAPLPFAEEFARHAVPESLTQKSGS